MTSHYSKEDSARLRDSIKAFYPMYVAGKAHKGNSTIAVTDKFTLEEVSRVPLANADEIEQSIAGAVEAFEVFKTWPSYRRQDVLQHVVRRMSERKEELSCLLSIEAAKAIEHSRVEVERAIDTFSISAAESTRMYGEQIPLDISQRSQDYHGHWKRVPIGPCSFISPFNFPINLAAHKIAPAIAAGCSFVLKPASQTPLGALVLGEILAETDLPKGSFSILPCNRNSAQAFCEDERFKLLSFTGSPDVGWGLKARAGKKKVVLELGGNAACIVDQHVDLDDAAKRIVNGAFYQAGQSCIGVQRIIAHEDIAAELRQKLCALAASLKMGDPLDSTVFMGPLIDEKEAIRVEAWVQEAVSAGANILIGGQRQGAFYSATILENVPRGLDLCRKEVFGPVAVFSTYSDFDFALEQVNEGEFGLQAGLFTNDLHKAQLAYERLDVGGLVINDVPSMRVDNMPYGGVKDSGFGREGVRFAMEDMCEIKLQVFRKL